MGAPIREGGASDVDLPAIRPSELQDLLLDKLNRVIGPLDHLPVNQERWSEVLGRGIAPFFKNLRDVARYVSGVGTRVRLLGQEVALEDILALEALRVFEPGVHQELPNLVGPLTKERSNFFVSEEKEKERDKERIEKAICAAPEERRARVRTLLGLLFPRAADALGGTGYQAGEGRANRRVGHAPALRAYLHATIDPGSASYTTIIETIELFGDHEKLRTHLASIDGAELEDLVERFPDFKDRIDAASVLVGAAELLRLQRRLSDEWDGLRPAPQIFLKRAIRSALEALPDEGAEREGTIRQIYEGAEKDSERFALISWFGTFPERERKQRETELLSEASTQELEKDLRARFSLRDPNELMDESDSAWLIFLGFGNDEDGRRKLDELADNNCALALLRACVAFSLEQGDSVFSLNKAERLFERPVLVRRIKEMQEEELTANDRDILSLAEAALASTSNEDSQD